MKTLRASRILSAMLTLAVMPSIAWTQSLPGFHKAAPFDEQVRFTRLDSGVRVLVNAPASLGNKPRTLVVFATPNGNTIEQTLGCMARGRDWRFDIQHIAAQLRRLREVDARRDFILAVVQAPKLSWPAFRREQTNANAMIRKLVTSLANDVSAERVVLACHSGGGSFVFGYLDAGETLPPSLERIVFLDANYSYSDDERHGDKLLAWLDGDAARRLVVVAYDDREVTLQGKKVVGPDGGTFRALQRMLARFRRDLKLTERQVGPFQQTLGLNGQIQVWVHPNPDNKILHTALVGEMNGLLHGLTLGTECETKWGDFGGPRAYVPWIQPQPFVDPADARAALADDVADERLKLPARPRNAPTGSQFFQQLADVAREQREVAVLHEIVRGNVPEFLRRLKPVRVQTSDEFGTQRSATYFVMCDYLAVGTNEDYFRVPMTPRTAIAIADTCEASLVTPKISDDIFAAAPVRFAPKPLTQDREAVATFWQHHQIIEDQLLGQPRGQLVAGIKKDVVLTNRLQEKPHRVAIYGWHDPDGRPIQSLYVGHVDWYVDYSHGVRLMSQQIIVDGKPLKVSDVLNDPCLCSLLSNEGPIDIVKVRQAARWGEP